jgi:signal transduction histidine kinase
MSSSRPRASDVAATCLVTAVGILATLVLRDEPSPGDRAFDALAVVIVVVGFAPIVVWRTRPVVPALSVLATLLVGAVLGYQLVGPTIVALGLIGLAASQAEGRVTQTLGVFAGLTFAVVMFFRADSDQVLAAIGGFAVGLVPALIGERLRAERVRARAAQELARRVEELRDYDVQRAVAEERLRIARDVHDITGHHLSAISLLSAGAGRTTRDADARAAFERIHGLTADALRQTRRSLGVLRAESEPAELAPPPRLEHVERLLDAARAAGLDVALRVEGEARTLSETAEMSAYRVVQESLANVMRHAGAHSVSIVVAYGPESVTVTVSDDGEARAPAQPGSGIEGMRERVALVGGSLVAGPRDDHGWSVRATLPLEEAA